jgi:hypothetical protein
MAAIVASDIKFHKTVTTGAAGNSVANTVNGTYLGKYASSSLWAGGSANDLFDDITGAQNAASQVDYAGLYIENSNAANDWASPAAYISAETAGGAALALGVDTTAQSAVGSATAQMLTIANNTTAPAAVTFTSPTTFGTGVALSTITKNGNGRGLWVRRSAANTAALSNDGGTITIQGDTGSL